MIEELVPLPSMKLFIVHAIMEKKMVWDFMVKYLIVALNPES